MAQLENFRLKVFRAVAEHLNFHKAADQLFLTQPAVTLQIKALESDLGLRLFDRAGGRVTLTRRGAVLLTYANKLAATASEAQPPGIPNKNYCLARRHSSAQRQTESILRPNPD